MARNNKVQSEIRQGLNVSKFIRRELCYITHIIQSAIMIHDIDIENTPKFIYEIIVVYYQLQPLNFGGHSSESALIFIIY